MSEPVWLTFLNSQECQVRPKLASRQSVDTMTIVILQAPDDHGKPTTDHAAAAPRDVANIASVWPHSWRGSAILTTHTSLWRSSTVAWSFLLSPSQTLNPRPRTHMGAIRGFLGLAYFSLPSSILRYPFTLKPQSQCRPWHRLALAFRLSSNLVPWSTISKSSSSISSLMQSTCTMSWDKSSANKNIYTSLNPMCVIICDFSTSHRVESFLKDAIKPSKHTLKDCS